jgi:hypothetical protein
MNMLVVFTPLTIRFKTNWRLDFYKGRRRPQTAVERDNCIKQGWSITFSSKIFSKGHDFFRLKSDPFDVFAMGNRHS